MPVSKTVQKISTRKYGLSLKLRHQQHVKQDLLIFYSLIEMGLIRNGRLISKYVLIRVLIKDISKVDFLVFLCRLVIHFRKIID